MEHKEETPQAKLRNQLTPIYSLASMVLLLEKDDRAKELIIDTANQVYKNKPEIDRILLEIDGLNSDNNKDIKIDENIKDKQWEWINEWVEEIMIHDGPDRHTDGSGVITDFIMALLEKRQDEWVENYEIECEKKNERYFKEEN